MSTGWNIYLIHYEELTGIDCQMKEGGSDPPSFYSYSFGVRFQIFNSQRGKIPFWSSSLRHLQADSLLCPADLDDIAGHAYLGDDLVQLKVACDGELD